MLRFLAPLLCALVALSLGTGTIAHATEAGHCSETTVSDAHVDESGPGKSSSDTGAEKGAEKGVAHQHGCHGHHFAALGFGKTVALDAEAPAPPVSALRATASGPALRPPQA